ncbi:MAG: HAD-IC family P-type ATPase [Clostridia bacterium]|nr:HAD-IC family P-type ATPase [Clostridia bacterium]
MEIKGLTAAEVAKRVAAGEVNGKQDLQTKSVRRIVFDNLFTLFNGLNLLLAILILTMSKGQNWNNTLFMGIVFFNLFVGIFQEIKAKKTIEKLSLISAPKVDVLRDGAAETITVEEIVKDDVMFLEAGRQVCSDAVVAEGEIEVNESLITGESDPALKKEGEALLSGSYVVSGKCAARVTHVGAENYATKVAAGARYIKKTNSEIMRSLRSIIRLMSIIVLPLGVALFLKQYLVVHNTMNEAVLKMAGSVVSMIPQGLIALSTTVFAVGVVRLSRHKTLSQDLYSIETLARVDVLCLDKTGTITEGRMVVTELVPETGEEEVILSALSSIVGAVPDNNPTYLAVKEFVAEHPSLGAAEEVFPFSSDRKWSGVNLAEGGLVMGAPEFVAPALSSLYREKCEAYQKDGKRVICVARAEKIEEYKLVNVVILGYLLIEDKIREEAPATLRYFAEQGVDIRVISGDNPVTVSAIAKKAGLAGAERYTDASTWKEDEDLEEMLNKYVIFGRVTPEQKLALIKTLKKEKHTVAMTGDGVNDVLALKEADCSVAMASGSDVAKSVASLVLLDSNFASMPRIVAEGRRSINNLQRSASLYLVKTIYATLLAIIFLFIGSYPFEPSHLTLVGATATGLPSFLLALEPNKERAEGSFLYNALRKALPGALTIVVGIVAIQIVSVVLPLSVAEADMLSVLMVALASFMVLFRVCLPMDVKHAVIFFSMLVLYMIGWLALPSVFNMMRVTELTAKMLYVLLALAACGAGIFVLFIFLERKLAARGKPKILKTLDLE